MVFYVKPREIFYVPWWMLEMSNDIYLFNRLSTYKSKYFFPHLVPCLQHLAINVTLEGEDEINFEERRKMWIQN